MHRQPNNGSGTECSLDIVFFPRILESLPPLPRQHSAAIGCTKNTIGVTVHSHCIESFESLLRRCRQRKGGFAVNCEKTQFFLKTLCPESGHFL